MYYSIAADYMYYSIAADYMDYSIAADVDCKCGVLK